MNPSFREHTGIILAITGSALSVIGTLWNNLALAHVTAMWFWMFSNPLLLAWAYGCHKRWWSDGISIEALGVMYAVFTVTNVYGLMVK
jgi:hypothetical protein